MKFQVTTALSTHTTSTAALARVFGAMVPVYGLDGNIERWMSNKGVLALEAVEQLTVVRRRKDKAIVRAFRNKADKSSNVADAPHIGTRYSYREHLSDGHRCHDLTRLDGKKHGLDYAPAELRPIFLQVIKDCTRISPTATAIQAQAA